MRSVLQTLRAQGPLEEARADPPIAAASHPAPSIATVLVRGLLGAVVPKTA